MITTNRYLRPNPFDKKSALAPHLLSSMFLKRIPPHKVTNLSKRQLTSLASQGWPAVFEMQHRQSRTAKHAHTPQQTDKHMPFQVRKVLIDSSWFQSRSTGQCNMANPTGPGLGAKQLVEGCCDTHCLIHVIVSLSQSILKYESTETPRSAMRCSESCSALHQHFVLCFLSMANPGPCIV